MVFCSTFFLVTAQLHQIMYITISQQSKFRVYEEEFTIPSSLGNFVNLGRKAWHNFACMLVWWAVSKLVLNNPCLLVSILLCNHLPLRLCWTYWLLIKRVWKKWWDMTLRLGYKRIMASDSASPGFFEVNGNSCAGPTLARLMRSCLGQLLWPLQSHRSTASASHTGPLGHYFQVVCATQTSWSVYLHSWEGGFGVPERPLGTHRYIHFLCVE